MLLRTAMLVSALSFAGAAAAGSSGTKEVVFIAGAPSHGFMAHDYLAGSKLLADRINAVPGFSATVYYDEWPAREKLDDASAIILYTDGADAHPALPHKSELAELSRSGVGIGMLHFAVEVPKQKGAAEWTQMIGGYFETYYSVNPFWRAEFRSFPAHPVAKGLKPFQLTDEWYYHMRFRDRLQGVQPVLSAVPPDETRLGNDGPYTGNPDVRAAVGKNQPEHVFWVSETHNDATSPAGRGFGCTGGHSHQIWAQDQFRKLVLNAIVWIAHGEVPPQGIESRRPDVDELLGNRDPGVQDEQVPPNFNRQGLADEIAKMNEP
ncbi:ThuA domain-containing protein [Bradyrhizobium sp.]|uniref:ThuA domain-containing protein n=1 Tax=Bradyrhizobium sp. TaxID=376 RepID=UPI0025C525B0|nr:ThuA domain-containing protein [Bradyrhizobium sp.]